MLHGLNSHYRRLSNPFSPQSRIVQAKRSLYFLLQRKFEGLEGSLRAKRRYTQHTQLKLHVHAHTHTRRSTLNQVAEVTTYPQSSLRRLLSYQNHISRAWLNLKGQRSQIKGTDLWEAQKKRMILTSVTESSHYNKAPLCLPGREREKPRSCDRNQARGNGADLGPANQ